jgi:hypothetical protein
MIYIGYPCIGKTTLAKEKNNFIDLESSYFNSNSKLNPSVLVITADAASTNYNKYENYCNLAIDLNNQNFNVFVSSHKQVTDYLINYYKNIGQTSKLCIIYPAEDLYADWSRRAFERYLKDKSDKNKRALDRILEYYTEDIKYLKNLCFTKNINSIEITEIDYKLTNYINNNPFNS